MLGILAPARLARYGLRVQRVLAELWVSNSTGTSSLRRLGLRRLDCVPVLRALACVRAPPRARGSNAPAYDVGFPLTSRFPLASRARARTPATHAAALRAHSHTGSLPPPSRPPSLTRSRPSSSTRPRSLSHSLSPTLTLAHWHSQSSPISHYAPNRPPAQQ
jgi:hypothetical protein